MTPKRFRLAACAAGCLLLLAVIAPVLSAQDLVDLTLNPKGRKYTPETPLEQVAQEFSLSQPGMLIIDYRAEPYQSQNGGYHIAAVDGSNLHLGREAVRVMTPSGGPSFGKLYTLHQVIIVSQPVAKRLTAKLTAFHVFQSMGVGERGDQMPSAMRLRVSFSPLGQAARRTGAPPEVDITGVWRYDSGSGQTWTFTPRGNGIYDAVETGYGNGRGLARVSGRRVTLDYTNTTAFGTQKSGSYAMTVEASGQRAVGGWLTDNGENGTTSWTQTSKTVPGKTP
ncbi:MAG: hypothetical protein FJY83_11415 [Candidatus Aminicenantes bacterium]|nr:hypothetical protein [Candidatus Aminicenantes bacterium]